MDFSRLVLFDKVDEAIISGADQMLSEEGALRDTPIGDRMKLAGLIAARGAAALARVVSAPYCLVQAMGVRAPERLYVAPRDIRTADPTVADEIYAGCFSFDGKVVNAQGRSPFAIVPPSPAWRRSLAGFSWLRHLHAADKALARANARALVGDFLSSRKTFPDDPAFEAPVIARRTLSWLAQSPILLEGADQDFYERFMGSLGRNVRSLLRALAGGAPGADRLICAIALAEFGVCADVAKKFQRRATHLLEMELSRQILRDGGHIGRNPQALVESLLDLLPLRQVYAVRGLHPPDQLLNSIDRMIPMLRMLQHGDGSLALFNGMGVASFDRLATILAYDDAPGSAPLNAPYSGYQRMQAGEALIIVDAGAPPPPAFSSAAHAGCLSFEYSLGGERAVVNCGAAAANQDAPRRLARATAAHSTLVVDDRSSCHIAARAGLHRWMAGQIVAGPAKVSVDRRQTQSGQVLDLAHDGYVREFGLVHHRILAFTHDGARLIGEDRLLSAGERREQGVARDFVLRFHIHPDARVLPNADGRKIDIALNSGARLTFEAAGFAPTIEESVFFAAPEGARKCAQIVVSGRASPQSNVRWSFSLVDDRGARAVPLQEDVC